MITNNSNLPDSVVRLVSGGQRTFGPREVSVTQLIRPPQMIWLEQQHAGELVEDAADRIWATYGTLMHLALERAGYTNALVEEQLTVEVDGWTVSGTPDLYEENGVLTDFKFVSVWTVADGIKDDWKTQLNLYAHLLRRHGFGVQKAQIVAMYRDWSKTRALEHGYPKQQAGIFEVELWPDADAHEVLASLVNQYAMATVGHPRPCTDEERWHRPDTWAAHKPSAKRATKLFTSELQAQEFAGRNGLAVEFRPGVDSRCQNYCRVSKVCPQFAATGGSNGLSPDDGVAV